MKRKQHPTAVGYSPSASKDFGILHPAFFFKKKKKDDNVFGYFTAFKASLGFPIWAAQFMAIVSAAQSFCCLFFKAFCFFHPPETGCVTVPLPYSQHIHGSAHARSVLHGRAVRPSRCRPSFAHTTVSVLCSHHGLVPFPRFHPTICSLLPFHFP